MMLSILIPTLFSREKLLARLMGILHPQINDDVEVLFNTDGGQKTIGQKRNELLMQATGKYVAFIDDDDTVSINYISLLFSGIRKGVDVCSLMGLITTDGKNPKPFIHSLNYATYFERDGIYYRPPNHLNCMRSEIAKNFKFPTKNYGEDTDWAMKICNARALTTEHKINETIYFYKYITKK